MTYPRELRGPTIPGDLKALIFTIANRLLDGPTEQHAVLRRQLAAAVLDRVTLTGVGAFGYFKLAPDAPTSLARSAIGGDVQITAPALDAPAGALIAVNDGRIDFVEIYTHGEHGWPDVVWRDVSLRGSVPLPIRPDDSSTLLRQH